ncbi:GM16846 [Drosophila sechellia]|uniref:GM16846 n=1 Tax=Drosophila sechellia TaxID=7238 RepID=B4IDF0_DROSE|nr:GM16846 [Drosophila sechellia]
MLKRSLKVLIAVVLSLMFTVSLVKIVLLIWSSRPAAPHSAPPLPTVDEWLESENLASYKQLFRDKVKRKK